MNNNVSLFSFIIYHGWETIVGIIRTQSEETALETITQKWPPETYGYGYSRFSIQKIEDTVGVPQVIHEEHAAEA